MNFAATAVMIPSTIWSPYVRDAIRWCMAAGERQSYTPNFCLRGTERLHQNVSVNRWTKGLEAKVARRDGWRCDYRENSHGASHLTATRNAPPADGCSTRKTSPTPSSGKALGKQRVTFIFEPIGIRVSHRSRRPLALTFCASVSTSTPAAWNFTNAGCRIGYLRSLRRSSRNINSPAFPES